MRLAVHSAMLAGLTPREAADLAAAHGYAGICLLLTSDAHLQDLHSAIRVTGMRSALTITRTSIPNAPSPSPLAWAPSTLASSVHRCAVRPIRPRMTQPSNAA